MLSLDQTLCISAQKSNEKNTCFIPGCNYDTEQCGMFNHLIYHQQPHHAISRPIALQMHQEWEKRQNEDIHNLDVAGRLKPTLR